MAVLTKLEVCIDLTRPVPELIDVILLVANKLEMQWQS
ncbi:hypothetical protein J2T12_000771 [Paenibacillus anaericanus]|nr:hypothetical protein [Paenibacillus anaericanus]